MSKDITLDDAEELVNEGFNLGEDSPLLDFINEKTGNIYEQDSTKVPALRDNLFEIEGIYDDQYIGSHVLTIKVNGKSNNLFSLNETFYSTSASILHNGDSLYIIALKTSDYNGSVAVTVIKSEEKSMFSQIKSIYGRACAIKNYFNWFEDRPGIQQAIHNLQKGEKYRRYSASSELRCYRKNEQALIYALTKENHLPEDQRGIEMLLCDPSPMKHHVDHRLSLITSISPIYKDRKPVTKAVLMKALHDRFYKMDTVIQQIVDYLVAAERAHKRGLRFLFVGSPGVGKTALSKAIADIINIPSEVFPLNGLSTTLELEGVESGFDNADSGRILNAFAAHGTSEILLVLDEIDKMCRQTHEGDPMNVFYSLLEGTLEDRYLGCPISCENTVIIATANSLDKIPEAIQNRFDVVIRFDDYSIEDKVHIANRHLIPEILKNYALEESGLSFPDKVIEYIAINYCEDEGTRDLRHRIIQLVCRFISDNSDGMENGAEYITQARVESILSALVYESPALYFNKHRDEYTEPVVVEIKRCIRDVNNARNSTSETYSSDRTREKLDYLLACRSNVGGFQEGFDLKAFNDHLHSNVYGMDPTIREVTLFYHTASLQGTTLNSNLALCGGYGTGKSTIIQSIADAMGYHHAKICLNGIDDVKELRGVPFSYTGSEPGSIMKEVKKAGSLKLLLQLDEIDKIARPEIYNVLIDLLDREFTDSYLGVPVDFKNTIFIATANEWDRVPPVIRDRFIVVNVDGYSRKEKAEIVSDYIIPRIEQGYAASNISVSINENARKYLLDNYCPGFGVRDAEKAMQKLVSSKLLDKAGNKNSTKIVINKADISKHLGKLPIPRGNFPVNIQPGISKALAISNGNLGNTFAIETVLIDGEGELEITGLPKETVIDSVKIAITCLKKMCPNTLNGKQVHIHLGEGAVQKDGPSAGIALFMSIYSAVIEKPLMINKPYDIAFTGELSLTGGVFAVGGVLEKIQAANDSGCIKVFIPSQNYERLDHDKLNQYSCEIVPVSNIMQVIKGVYSSDYLYKNKNCI